MITHNSHYFNACKISHKLLLLLICVFLSACSGQNNTKQVLPVENKFQISESAININTASVAELEKPAAKIPVVKQTASQKRG